MVSAETLTDDIVRELVHLIGIARPSAEPNGRIIRHIQSVLEPLGYMTRQFISAGLAGNHINLYCAKSRKPTLLFCAHTDTVPPGDQSRWTETLQDPWNAKVKEGRVYGLGASDTLGSIALLLSLARHNLLFEESALLFTAQEEIGALGAYDVLRLEGVPGSVELVVVCEPTNNLVVLGEKGYVPFDIVIRGIIDRNAKGRVEEDDVKVLLVVGQEAHSARPAQGKNAIFETAAMEDVEEIADSHVVLSMECRGVRNKVPGLCAVRYCEKKSLKSYGKHTEWQLKKLLPFLRRLQEFQSELAETRDDRFQPPEVTFNAGSLTAMMDEVVIACDLRPLPGQDGSAIVSRILETARAMLGESNVSLRIPHGPIPPVWSEIPKFIEDELRDRIDPYGKSAYTEAAMFVQAGFRAVICGPGNLLVHRANEYIDISALEEGSRLYQRLSRLSHKMRQRKWTLET
jgi:acetylornithine deacetylase/succinyl-diaminopimelate desuccinylase-like protein